jgi:hypothetical protein
MCNNHKSSVLSSSLALAQENIKKDIGNYLGDKAQSFEHRVAIFGTNNLELNESPRLRSNRRWNIESN